MITKNCFFTAFQSSRFYLKKFKIVTLLLILGCSCSQTDEPQYYFKYLFDGKNKEIRIFKDMESLKKNNDYYSLTFDSLYRLKEVNSIIGKKKDGYSVEYFYDTGSKYITTYVDGKRHGLQVCIDKNDNFVWKEIFVNGRSETKMFNTLLANDTSVICSVVQIFKYKFFNSEKATIVGRYFQDLNYKIIGDSSEFYFVNGSKEVAYNEPYKFNVFCVFDNQPIYQSDLSLKLGDKEYNFNSSLSKTMNCEVKPYRKGINVLIGEIIISSDTMINGNMYVDQVKLPFIHQFIAK